MGQMDEQSRAEVEVLKRNIQDLSEIIERIEFQGTELPNLKAKRRWAIERVDLLTQGQLSFERTMPDDAPEYRTKIQLPHNRLTL